MTAYFQICPAITVPEGDGVEVKRLFPLLRQRMNYDPFVLFDHFALEGGGGFPSHPHRGFEGITYLFSGSMHHQDNLGNDAIVHGGGAQCFTAGRGLVHSEMPDANSPTSGIQLWINLPKQLKTIPPAYQQLEGSAIPETQANGVTVRTIVGPGSPITVHTPTLYQDLRLSAGSVFVQPLDLRWQGIVYVVSGEINVGEQAVAAETAILFAQQVTVELTAKSAAHVMLAAGLPHGEPIHQHGPYVD
jgi:hypothetical protein